jgi:hypothetical protein
MQRIVLIRPNFPIFTPQASIYGKSGKKGRCGKTEGNDSLESYNFIINNMLYKIGRLRNQRNTPYRLDRTGDGTFWHRRLSK